MSSTSDDKDLNPRPLSEFGPRDRYSARTPYCENDTPKRHSSLRKSMNSTDPESDSSFDTDQDLALTNDNIPIASSPCSELSYFSFIEGHSTLQAVPTHVEQLIHAYFNYPECFAGPFFATRWNGSRDSLNRSQGYHAEFVSPDTFEPLISARYRYGSRDQFIVVQQHGTTSFNDGHAAIIVSGRGSGYLGSGKTGSRWTTWVPNHLFSEEVYRVIDHPGRSDSDTRIPRGDQGNVSLLELEGLDEANQISQRLRQRRKNPKYAIDEYYAPFKRALSSPIAQPSLIVTLRISRPKPTTVDISSDEEEPQVKIEEDQRNHTRSPKSEAQAERSQIGTSQRCTNRGSPYPSPSTEYNQDSPPRTTPSLMPALTLLRTPQTPSWNTCPPSIQPTSTTTESFVADDTLTFHFKTSLKSPQARIRRGSSVRNISQLFDHAACAKALAPGARILTVRVGDQEGFNIMKGDDEDFRTIIERSSAFLFRRRDQVLKKESDGCTDGGGDGVVTITVTPADHC